MTGTRMFFLLTPLPIGRGGGRASFERTEGESVRLGELRHPKAGVWRSHAPAEKFQRLGAPPGCLFFKKNVKT